MASAGFAREQRGQVAVMVKAPTVEAVLFNVSRRNWNVLSRDEDCGVRLQGNGALESRPDSSWTTLVPKLALGNASPRGSASHPRATTSSCAPSLHGKQSF